MDATIRPYASTSTDTLLARTMESVGDNDPATVQQATGKPLHFDPTTSASVHRAGNTSNAQGISDIKHEAVGQIQDKVVERAIDGAAELAGKYGGVVSGLGLGVTSIVQLGSLYNQAIDGAKREGEHQMALSASDAGVVALTQSLDFSPAFKSDMAVAHNGSSNVAAAMTASLASTPSTKTELQFRADKGFVDAAGYAKNAAAQMKPLYAEANSKLSAAKTADSATASKLQAQASALFTKAAEVEKKYLGPVYSRTTTDAAYGVGVLYAVHCAIHSSPSAFESTFAKANANVQSVTPASVTIHG
jgi:hypothetical protein